MPRRTAPLPDPIITPEELAAELKLDVNLLKQWRHQGRGPAWFKPGGRFVRYRRSAVDRWLAESGDATMSAAAR